MTHIRDWFNMMKWEQHDNNCQTLDMIDKRKHTYAQFGQKNQRNVAPLYHHIELTIEYQSRIMGAWGEYNQRPWRSVANTFQSYSNNSITAHKHKRRWIPHNALKGSNIQTWGIMWNGLSLFD